MANGELGSTRNQDGSGRDRPAEGQGRHREGLPPGNGRPPGAGAPPDDDLPEPEEVKPDFIDIVAFTIACFQLLLPGLLIMIGAVGVVYLLLWLLAR